MTERLRPPNDGERSSTTCTTRIALRALISTDASYSLRQSRVHGIGKASGKEVGIEPGNDLLTRQAQSFSCFGAQLMHSHKRAGYVFGTIRIKKKSIFAVPHQFG